MIFFFFFFYSVGFCWLIRPVCWDFFPLFCFFFSCVWYFHNVFLTHTVACALNHHKPVDTRKEDEDECCFRAKVSCGSSGVSQGPPVAVYLYYSARAPRPSPAGWSRVKFIHYLLARTLIAAPSPPGPDRFDTLLALRSVEFLTACLIKTRRLSSALLFFCPLCFCGCVT